MELSIKTYNKLINLIDDAKKNKNYELEARFWNKKDKNLINEENYNKIFKQLTFSKENNGFGFKYEMKNILDVILDKSSLENDTESIRMSINNKDDIKKYWLNIDFDKIEKVYIEKEKLDKIDDENYNIRFSLNNELQQNNILNKNKNLLSSNTFDKTYRLKNRYSIYTDDKLFVIDMSSIKIGNGVLFSESNTLNESLKYEIEIEFIGKEENFSNEDIAKRLLYYCEIILKIINNSEILISNNQVTHLKKNYQNIIKSYNNDYFIAASPVTIHRENLFKTEEIKNILNKYAITLKADGERYLLMVNKDGKIYLFNNAFKFIDTGYEDKEWINSIIEGEYIESIKEFYMYDILFSKGEDVRRRYLIDIKDTKMATRLELINQFEKSSTRKIYLEYNEQNVIKLIRKKYLQSVRADGSDIFDKVKEIWSNRKFNNFNVDGVIFVPKYEYYPLRGGPWRTLFKWKPPHLNTIDFLIKTFKDDNDRDIKYPYIGEVQRLDNKKETFLKQYKIVQLFVTDEKTIFHNQKSTKKKYPVLFNPYNVDNVNSELYNNVKILIDEEGRMVAYDPITNEMSHITDNTIVEFGYDETKEEGFKWIPHKTRNDKTFLYKSGKDMFGNNKYIANDIFRAIKSPITEEMITTGNIPLNNSNDLPINKTPYYLRENNSGKRLAYQNVHNHYIKLYLLEFSSPSYIQELPAGYHGKLLDLCCGRGVDINKIKKARYAEIVGMDIDYNNIKEAQELFKSLIIPPPKAYYIRGDSSKLIFPDQASSITEADRIYTKKYIPAKYLFDTVSLQFCFHYFFENEITLRTILQNINDNLKIGGFVIGTTFDGERVNDLFKHENTITGKGESGDTIWKIEKKYTSTKLAFTSSKPNYGKQIDVLVKTIGVVHPEYLVNFNYLDKIMMEYGFSKVFVRPFEEFYNDLMEGKNILNLPEKDFKQNVANAHNMSEDQKKYSFLNSAFMYKKEKNSSDSLIKKLVELMEKKSKLKKKDDITVYKVDENLEHLIEDTLQKSNENL
jgi:SAM-dependent methyltransferase